MVQLETNDILFLSENKSIKSGIWWSEFVVIDTCRFGLEQEYTLLQKNVKWPLGWPAGGYPGPQVCPKSTWFMNGKRKEKKSLIESIYYLKKHFFVGKWVLAYAIYIIHSCQFTMQCQTHFQKIITCKKAFWFRWLLDESKLAYNFVNLNYKLRQYKIIHILFISI